MAKDDVDPLDAAGRWVNFLTHQPYSDARRAWADVWSKFPIYAEKPRLAELQRSVRDNKVTIVISGTGSGKTVCCPPLVLKHVVDRMLPGRVAVTIPKRATALTAATTGAMTLDVELGQEVGYSYRGAPGEGRSFNVRTKMQTRLLYTTDGLLVAKSYRDPELREFAAIIIDEAHERSVQTDMLMLILKQALERRPTLRVVIMSATIDPGIFLDYFGGSCGLVRVSGSPMQPIDIRYADHDSTPDSYVQEGMARVDAILRAPMNDQGHSDIMFFVATTRDANKGCQVFDRQCQKDVKDSCAVVDCATLYSKMNASAQEKAIGAAQPPYKRKLVFATNVAESSLTMKTLKYMIDGGFQLINKWHPASHSSIMIKGRPTQAQINQRIGRVGRTAPGVAYLMYTQKTRDALPQYPEPAIANVDVTEYVLSWLDSGKSLAVTLEDFGRMILPPTRDQIDGALAFLRFHRMVDGEHGNGKITAFGKWVAKVSTALRMELPNALLVCWGIAFQCPQPALVLASILESTAGDPSVLWGNGIARSIQGVLDAKSDHISLLKLYRDVFLDADTGRPMPLADVVKTGLMNRAWMNAHRKVREDLRTLERQLAQPDASDALRADPVLMSRVPMTGGRRPGHRHRNHLRGHSHGHSHPPIVVTQVLRDVEKGAQRLRLEKALFAARLYHVAVPAKGKGNVAGMMTTVAPKEKIEAVASADFAKEIGACVVYENLTQIREFGKEDTNAKTDFKLITSLPDAKWVKDGVAAIIRS